MRTRPVIVIAYGNPLRGDDGLAWRAAKRLKETFASAAVEILQCHQLAPELAADVSRAQAVIFVDAAAADPGKTHPGETRIVEIGEQETGPARGSPFHHQFSPTSVLALTAQLYGIKSRAFVATLTGDDFGPGERLSPTIERALPEFVARLEELIQVLGSAG